MMNYCITHKVPDGYDFHRTIHWCQDNIEWENPFRWNRDVYTYKKKFWKCDYYFNDASDALYFWIVWG